jgi:quercetin dioxygenase-like cupin family protein
MKALLLSALFLTLASWLAGSDGSGATYADHAKVATALAKNGELAQGEGYRVTGAHRDGPGRVEVHEKEADIFYVTDGEATFVTGGTMVDGKMAKTGQWLGNDIQGGETHHLTKGDVVVVPAGTPHWFKEVRSSIHYVLVKVIKP